MRPFTSGRGSSAGGGAPRFAFRPASLRPWLALVPAGGLGPNASCSQSTSRDRSTCAAALPTLRSLARSIVTLVKTRRASGVADPFARRCDRLRAACAGDMGVPTGERAVRGECGREEDEGEDDEDGELDPVGELAVVGLRRRGDEIAGRDAGAGTERCALLRVVVTVKTG